jgi:hypothetical protein
LLPEYLATNSATAWASSPVTRFCGIGDDEKPPLRIAYSTLSTSSLRSSKFGPSLRSREPTSVADPSAPATVSVWQPAQFSLKSTAPR